MSIFQLISVWTLRALAVWGLIEIGGGLYDDMGARFAAMQTLAGHEAAMQRLTARADAAEHAARAAQARLEGAQSSTVETLLATSDAGAGNAIAQTLRDDLMSYGAQAPVVDAEQSGIGAGLRRLLLHVRWREAAQTAPAVLYRFAARHPKFKVRSLNYARTPDGAFVDAHLDLEGVLRTPSARR